MYNSDALVEKLVVKISQPDGRFSSQEILDFVHFALVTDLFPPLIKSREEFFVVSEDVSVVSGTDVYQIPKRAYGGILRQVSLVDSNGNIRDLNRVDEGSIERDAVGIPDRFYLRGNDIILHPEPNLSGYSLRVSYWLFPSKIVPLSECARINNINGAVLTLDSVPSSWTTSNSFDIVKSSADFFPVSRDLTASNVSSPTITLSGTVSSRVAVGDYLCLAEESPYAYLQRAYYPALMQFSVGYMHESLGNLELKADSINAGREMLAMLTGVFAERTQGNPTVIESPLL